MARISTRYGEALYALVAESGDLDLCLEQAIIVRDALCDSKSRRVLAHPHISNLEKQDFLRNAFSGLVHRHLMDFMGLLISRNRGDMIVDSLSEFIDLGNQAKGYAEARVISAATLSERQVSALQELLDRKLGKQVALTLEVDPCLIGGFSIYVDGHYVDGTVRGRLYEMKNSVIINSIIKGGEVQ